MGERMCMYDGLVCIYRSGGCMYGYVLLAASSLKQWRSSAYPESLRWYSFVSRPTGPRGRSPKRAHSAEKKKNETHNLDFVIEDIFF